MKKLQTSQFYQDEVLTNAEQYAEYIRVQIERRNLKKDKKRDELYYKKFFDELIEYLDNSRHYEMICYGTRNNNERDLWKHWFNQFKYDVSVYSLDIASGSEADFVCDFNKLPSDFENRWNIIFSNSLDHAVDATETLFGWIKSLKSGGLAIVFLCYGTTPSNTDCSTFDNPSANAFVEDNKDNKDFRILKYYHDSTTLIIRRI